MAAPPAVWCHLRLITKKVSGNNFVNGVPAGTCVAFTIDKVGNANYTPKVNDDNSQKHIHTPSVNICLKTQIDRIQWMQSICLFSALLSTKGIWNSMYVHCFYACSFIWVSTPKLRYKVCANKYIEALIKS